MSKVSVAATQMRCSWDIDDNVHRAESLIREAAAKGAQIILIQELFETPYFCIEQAFKHLDLATSVDESPTIKKMSALASELSVVLPVSWFERASRGDQSILTHSFDLAEIKSFRESWGLFRDRRPDQYAALATFDGKVSG